MNWFLSILVVIGEKMGARKIDSGRIPSAHFGVHGATEQLHGFCQTFYFKAELVL